MSRRLAGLPPEYPGSTQQQTIFSRKKRKLETASEPISEMKKVSRSTASELSVKETENTIPLSKKGILGILSREMPIEKASIIETFMRRSNIKNQQVPSIYSSYFFRKDIIKEFQKNVINLVPHDKLTNFPLSTYNLYNKDDILNNTTFRPDIIGSRNIEKTTGYTRESKENMEKFITFLSKLVCSDIKPAYAKSAVERAIDLTKNEEKFDILVASTRVLEDVSIPINRRLEGIVAFVIVELGECKKYPSAYSINLICTNTKKAITGTGSILMGAFLYTILSHPNNSNPTDAINFPPGNGFLKVSSKRLSDGRVIENCTFGSQERLIPIEQIAVLELASAYINPGGLCMYEKFGFTYDQTMFSDVSKGINCFADRDNLPMLIDFNSKPGYAELNNEDKKQKVVNITVGLDRGFPKSKICSMRGDNQRLLGLLKSIKLYIDNEDYSSLDDYLPTTTEAIIINQIKNINKDPNSKMTLSRSATSPVEEGSIEQTINYLENPPTPDDPIMKAKIDNLISYLPPEKKIKTGGMKSRKIKRKISRRFTKKRY